MHIALLLLAVLSAAGLSACDEAPPAPAALAPEEAARARLQGAAERECAELTNHLPEKLEAMTPEMRSLTEREYKLCVNKVAGGS